jgi:hypothetical protein
VYLEVRGIDSPPMSLAQVALTRKVVLQQTGKLTNTEVVEMFDSKRLSKEEANMSVVLAC